MKISDLEIKDKFDFFDIKFATEKEILNFKKDIFDIDQIFKFYNYSGRICKYINIIFSISHWGDILHSYKPDFQIPLLFYWHYYKKGSKIKYDDILKQMNGDPKIEKFKSMFIKQFYVVFMSFLDKLKRAYSNIYNFPYGNFKKQEFSINDKIFLGSGLKDELLSYLENLINFELSDEFEKFRQLRNSSVHNIGGRETIFTFQAKNNNDFLREMVFEKNHISDNQFLDLIKILLPKLDQLCTLFNTINLKYFKYLVKFDMPGKLIKIK